MVPKSRLEGKIAIITGSASGLGKATAHEFVQHGAQVIIADNDTQLGPKVAKELGHSAEYVECDVTVEAQVEAAVNFAITNYGKLDIMYNNAGITGPVIPPSITELDLNEFEKVMRINVTGVIAGIYYLKRKYQKENRKQKHKKKYGMTKPKFMLNKFKITFNLKL